MTEIVFTAELFTLPKSKGVPMNMSKMIEVSVEGMTSVLNMLKGLNYSSTFVFDERFEQNAKPLLSRALNEGHKIVSINDFKTVKESVLGIHLSGNTIQHLPIDIYSILVKLGSRKSDLTITIPIWSFSEALYEPAYRLSSKYYKNCGDKLLQRVAGLIIKLK